MNAQTARIIEAKRGGMPNNVIAVQFGVPRKQLNVIFQRARSKGALPKPVIERTERQRDTLIEQCLLAGQSVLATREICRAGMAAVDRVRSVLVTKGLLQAGKQRARKARKVTVTPIEPRKPIEAPPTYGRAALALEAVQAVNGCRYPIGQPHDEDFHFCGVKRMPSNRRIPDPSYCQSHHELTHRRTDPPVKREENLPVWTR